MFSFTSVIPAQAANISDTNKVITIAQNIPQYVLGNDKEEWRGVIAFNVKPLYDFNNKLIAYSVDLESNIDNTVAYTIISASEEDAPVYEFCEGKSSPYDKIDSDEMCIYNGVVSYYAEKTSILNNKDIDIYYNIKNNSQLSDQEVSIYKNVDKNKKYISSKPEISKSERNKLITKNGLKAEKAFSNIIKPMYTILTTKILNVPDYRWQCGCAPTAAAMVLKYDFSSLLSNVSSTNLINHLADAMDTDSNGSTKTINLPSAIIETMGYYTGINMDAFNDPDGKGKYWNTFGEYCTEINNNYPVIVNVYGSTQTAPSYPDGFGNHSMAGVGYRITTSYDYIIVHDTGVDGDVYCNYDSSAFGTPWHTYVLLVNMCLL